MQFNKLAHFINETIFVWLLWKDLAYRKVWANLHQKVLKEWLQVEMEKNFSWILQLG